MAQVNSYQAQENGVTCLSNSQQSHLRRLLEKGLPIASKPYQVLADTISVSDEPVTEEMVIAQIAQWQNDGLIRRFGLVVKHRNLGFNANAMVVWDIPNSEIDLVAGQLSRRDEVSLCYRRPRRLPNWTYNLFCMIHGTDREVVLDQIERITEELSLTHIKKDVLFSTRAFKQHGARYGKSNLTAKGGISENC